MSQKFQSALMDEILDDLNKPENAKYQTFFCEWFKPFLYAKQKMNPMVGTYQKVKIKEKLDEIDEWWTRAAFMKIDHLTRKIPQHAKISMYLIVTKMKETSTDSDLNEDITVSQIHNSQTVRNKVPLEIVQGFSCAHQTLRILNLRIQNT